MVGLDPLLLLGAGAGARNASDAGREVALKTRNDARQQNRNSIETQEVAFTVSMAVPRYEPPIAAAS